MPILRRDDPETREERLAELMDEFRATSDQLSNTFVVNADLRQRARTLAQEARLQAEEARTRARAVIARKNDIGDY